MILAFRYERQDHNESKPEEEHGVRHGDIYVADLAVLDKDFGFPRNEAVLHGGVRSSVSVFFPGSEE